MIYRCDVCLHFRPHSFQNWPDRGGGCLCAWRSLSTCCRVAGLGVWEWMGGSCALHNRTRHTHAIRWPRPAKSQLSQTAWDRLTLGRTPSEVLWRTALIVLFIFFTNTVLRTHTDARAQWQHCKPTWLRGMLAMRGMWELPPGHPLKSVLSIYVTLPLLNLDTTVPTDRLAMKRD